MCRVKEENIMLLKDAMRNLSQIESDLFINRISNYDYSVFDIEYKLIIDDFCKGENNQVYKDFAGSGEHAFLYIMGIRTDIELVANTIKKICHHNYWSFPLKRFSYLIAKYPDKFVDRLTANYIW